jgi:opacity protein-like surface antigen
MFKRAGIAVAAILLLTSTALGQDTRFEFSLNGAGLLSKESDGNGIRLTPTQGWGVLASLGLKLAAKHSLEINYTRTKDSQIYNAPPFVYRITSTISEFSGAYVVRPLKTEKLEPFLLIGAGALVFNPDDTLVNGNQFGIGAVRQTKPAFLYGGGADYPVFGRFAVRLQYRGIFYNAPDFRVTNLVTGARGHLAEPSVGVVFKF